MSNILSRMRDLVVYNSEHHALALSLKLEKLPVNERRKWFGGSHPTGWLYLFRDPEFPDIVLETVQSQFGGDAITSTYIGNHSSLANVGTLISAREDLIRAIAQEIGLSIPAIGIPDPVRGRDLSLKELSTGQLIDLLAERNGVGLIQVVSDTHNVAAPIATV
jgi:hypothetical protein